MQSDDDDDDDDPLMAVSGLSVSMQREELGTDFLLEHALSVPMLRPRVPADVLFVLGGWSRDGVCSIMETYDDRIHRWFKVGLCHAVSVTLSLHLHPYLASCTFV